MKNIDNTQDLMDSRDIIKYLEEITEERNELQDQLDEVLTDDEDNHVLIADIREELEPLIEEVESLQDFCNEADNCADWSYGEAVIHEDYFTEHTKQIIEDCYEMPEGFNNGQWPWNNLEMDWEGAAEDLKQDYREIDWDGTTFFVRA